MCTIILYTITYTNNIVLCTERPVGHQWHVLQDEVRGHEGAPNNSSNNNNIYIYIY